jgi:hypothetical protein
MGSIVVAMGVSLLVSPVHIDAAPRAVGPHEHRSSCLQRRVISALQPHWLAIIHPISRAILRPDDRLLSLAFKVATAGIYASLIVHMTWKR